MRDHWYGDNRDLAKWGVLLQLADRYDAKHILHVMYYRTNGWAPVQVDGEELQIPPAVIDHFRRAVSIAELQSPVPLDVITEPFENRQKYLELVRQRIKARTQTPGLIFLDPDTGLAPPSPAVSSKREFVKDNEVRAMWEDMQIGDVLVLHQHKTKRNGPPWVAMKRLQFEATLGIPEGSSKLAEAPRITMDALFFFVQKEQEAQVQTSNVEVRPEVHSEEVQSDVRTEVLSDVEGDSRGEVLGTDGEPESS